MNNIDRSELKSAKKALKTAKRLKRQGITEPEGKKCDVCCNNVMLLIRCQIDESRRWQMVCGKCWKHVSGGVADGDAHHPYYR